MTVEARLDPMQALLPFLVNGTLSGTDRAEVEGALARDPALAEDMRFLDRLRDGLQSLPIPPSPGEFGLARLLRDIDRAEPVRKAGAGNGARLRTIVGAGLSVAAAIVLGLALVFGPDRSGPGYIQASGLAGSGDLGVTFVPAAASDAITALLQRHDLVVVDGPSALGLYWLDAPEGADITALSAALRAEKGIVETVSLPE